MADNSISFLTPLLASCGAIAAFLGNRHQHLSGLIRKKTEYISSKYTELTREEVDNIMAQIILFADRNRTIEEAVFSSLTGGILFATDIVIFHFDSDISLGWTIVFVGSGLTALAYSLYLAICEFSQSKLTLDLEIILAGSKKHTIFTNKGKLDVNNLLTIYGDSDEQPEKYLQYLLRQAKKIGDKKRGRLKKLIHSQKLMPQGKSSLLRMELITFINSILKESKIAIAFPELICTFRGRSIVSDIVVFESKNILKDDDGEIANMVTTAPSWVIEILSPNQSTTKVIKNIVHCLNCGTEVGWIIDPVEKIILVYQPNKQEQVVDILEAELIVPEFARSIKLTAGDVFGWLKVG
jgi:Uma2 family endonuclease